MHRMHRDHESPSESIRVLEAETETDSRSMIEQKHKAHISQKVKMQKRKPRNGEVAPSGVGCETPGLLLLRVWAAMDRQ